MFGGFPECLAKQQKLLCGLSCDPRQSEYVVLDGESLGNQTATFYIWYCPLATYDQKRIASLTLHPSTLVIRTVRLSTTLAVRA